MSTSRNTLAAEMRNKQSNPLNELLESNRSAKTPVSSLLIDGERAYKAKQYEKALQCYSEAIDNARDQACDFIYLYELRSSVYAKLKQTNLALNDARKMVRLDRRDARGYIRCGQIEQLCKNIPSAMKFYEHGLKNVVNSDPLYCQLEARLQRMREVAADNVIFEKGTDPLQVLPAELLEMVLSYMSYRQVVNLLGVSKMWKNRLCSLDLLRHTIDFSDCNTKAVSYTCVNAALKRLGKNKKYVFLSNLSGPAAELVKSHLQRWINWESLEHFHVDRINTTFDTLRWDKYRLKAVEFGVNASIQPQTMLNILKSAPKLQKAIFQNVAYSRTVLDLNNLPLNEELEVLQIDWGGPAGTPLLAPSKWMYPNIRRFRMTRGILMRCFDFSSCSGLFELDFRGSTFHSPPGAGGFVGPPRLEFLYVSSENALLIRNNISTPVDPVSFRLSLDHLSGLHLSGFGDSLLALQHILKMGLRPAQLKYLFLHRDANHTENIPLVCFEALETLVWEGINLSDDMSTDFANWFPSLVTLDILTTRITGAFIGDLLRRPGNKIESLTLRFCHKVSIDTIAWARERGVSVRIVHSNDFSNGGRRVRYE